MRVLRFLAAGVVAAAGIATIIASGGGGGSSTPPPGSTAGLFIDAEVRGLTTRSGDNPTDTTDDNGLFLCDPDSMLEVSIGAVQLPILLRCPRVLTPNAWGEDYAGQAVTNVARFIQSLDGDGIVSNGIDVTAAAALLANLNPPIDGSAFLFTTAAAFQNAIAPAMVAAGNKTLIGEATALNNLAAGADDSFDKNELAGKSFVFEFFDGGMDFGFIEFQPLADPGDSGSNGNSVANADGLDNGGDGSVDTFTWSVGTDPNTSTPETLIIAGGATDPDTAVFRAGGSDKKIFYTSPESISGPLLTGVFYQVLQLTENDLTNGTSKSYTLTNSQGSIGVTFNADPKTAIVQPPQGSAIVYEWALAGNGQSVQLLKDDQLDWALVAFLGENLTSSGQGLLAFGQGNGMDLLADLTPDEITLDDVEIGTVDIQ